MLDLKQIQFFIACVEQGSFSKAAEALYTTQSSVSKIIKSMEEEIGEQLFERKAKGIILTLQGERIYAHSMKIYEHVQMMLQKEQNIKREQLAISCKPSIWFADYFLKFFKLHQEEEIQYSINFASVQEVIERVQKRIDDAGFVSVMKEQITAFSYYLSRNYLEFEFLLENDLQIYPGVKNEMYEHSDSDIDIMKLQLVQNYADEFSPDNYCDVSLGKGKRLSDKTVKVITNSDYILNKLLETTELVNLRMMDIKSVNIGITPFKEDTGKMVWGYIKRKGEELSHCTLKYIEFIKNEMQLT